MPDINTIITLEEDKKYTIVSQINYENIQYLYLANIEDITDFAIGTIEETDFVEIKDEQLLSNLIIKFAESINKSDN